MKKFIFAQKINNNFDKNILIILILDFLINDFFE